MRNEKFILSSVPCAFDPEFIITPEIWTISLVQKKSDKIELRNEHANLILISSLFGEINVTKLHIMGSGHGRKKGFKDVFCAASTYLHVQIVDNVSKGVPIVDDESLQKAIQAVLSAHTNKPKTLDKLFNWRTWQISKEQGMALVTDVAQQEYVCHTVQPTFSIFGHESFFNRARSNIAGLFNGMIIFPRDVIGSLFLTMKNMTPKGWALFTGVSAFYIYGAGTRAATAGVAVATSTLVSPAVMAAWTTNPTLFALNMTCAPYLPYLAYGFMGYLMHTIGTVRNEPLRADVGHSCFTWARETLVKHLGEEIRNDPCFAFQNFDRLAVVTTRHINATTASHIELVSSKSSDTKDSQQRQ